MGKKTKKKWKPIPIGLYVSSSLPFLFLFLLLFLFLFFSFSSFILFYLYSLLLVIKLISRNASTTRCPMCCATSSSSPHANSAWVAASSTGFPPPQSMQERGREMGRERRGAEGGYMEGDGEGGRRGKEASALLATTNSFNFILLFTATLRRIYRCTHAWRWWRTAHRSCPPSGQGDSSPCRRSESIQWSWIT